MKKLIFLFALLFFSVGFSITKAYAESVIEPQWSEFCPPLYENVVFKPAKANSKRNMENNYWALRKAKFDKSVAECKVISKNDSELGACFGRVVNLERNKTAQRTQSKYESNAEVNMQIRDGGYWWY